VLPLAGLAVDYWKNSSEFMKNWKLDKQFEPRLENKREVLYDGWQKTVKTAMAFK
jgi:glycerol kinase